MTIRKRTITLTGDNVTGAGFLTGVTSTGHASGALGLGSAYAAIRQVRAYGAAGDASGDILVVDADGVEIFGATAVDTSGALGAESHLGSAAATSVGVQGGVTGSGRGIRLVGVPYYLPGTQTVGGAETVTGAIPSMGSPIARSPVTVYMSAVAANVVTVDLFVED